MSYQRGNRQGIGAIDADENPMWSGADDPMFQRTRAERAIASNIIELPGHGYSSIGAIERVDRRTGSAACTPAQRAAIAKARQRVAEVEQKVAALVRAYKHRYPNVTAANLRLFETKANRVHGLHEARRALEAALRCGRAAPPPRPPSGGSAWVNAAIGMPRPGRSGKPPKVPKPKPGASAPPVVSSGGGTASTTSSGGGGGGGGGSWWSGGGGGDVTAPPTGPDQDDGLDLEAGADAGGGGGRIRQAMSSSLAGPALLAVGGIAALYLVMRKR